MTSGGDDGTSSRQADTERSAEEATAVGEPEAEGLPVEPEAATPGSESAAEISVDGPGVDASAEQAGGTDETTASTACAEAGGTSVEECADETAPVDEADTEGSTVP